MNDASAEVKPAISDSLSRALGIRPKPPTLDGIQLNFTVEVRRLTGEHVFPPVASGMKLNSPDNPEMREININQVSGFLNGLVRSVMAQLSNELPAAQTVTAADPKILTMPPPSRDDLA